MGSVIQHDQAQIPGGKSGIDAVLVSLLYQMGEITGMIDMGMRKDYPLDGMGIDREIFIPLVRLFSSSLEKSAIYQNSMSVRFD
jgi:hypothetical protein